LGHRFREVGGRLLVSTPIIAIRWRSGRVEIDCLQSSKSITLEASKAIITLPLGVLQSGDVQFDPEPRDALNAANRMRTGEVHRVVMLFRQHFGADINKITVPNEVKNLSFLYSFEKIPPVWWTQHPERSPMLTGWVGGRPAATLLHDRTAERGLCLLQELAEMFGVPRAKLQTLRVESLSHDWSSDSFSRGPSSYVPAGAIDASEVMARPVEGALYLAGEHTDTTAH
jgi:monoamine oxidase